MSNRCRAEGLCHLGTMRRQQHHFRVLNSCSVNYNILRQKIAHPRWDSNPRPLSYMPSALTWSFVNETFQCHYLGYWLWLRESGALFAKMTPSHWLGIPIIKMRLSVDRLKLIMGISISGIRSLFGEHRPWLWVMKSVSCLWIHWLHEPLEQRLKMIQYSSEGNDDSLLFSSSYERRSVSNHRWLAWHVCSITCWS